MPRFKPMSIVTQIPSHSLLVLSVPPLLILIIACSQIDEIRANISPGSNLNLLENEESLYLSHGSSIEASRSRRSARVKKGGVLLDTEFLSNNSNKSSSDKISVPVKVKNVDSPIISPPSTKSVKNVKEKESLSLNKRQSQYDEEGFVGNDNQVPILLTRSNSHHHHHHHRRPHHQVQVQQHIDNHFARDGMRMNRFYFFNDQRPATRLADVNIYGHGHVEPTPNVRSLQLRYKLKQQLKRKLMANVNGKPGGHNSKRTADESNGTPNSVNDNTDGYDDVIDKVNDEFTKLNDNKNDTGVPDNGIRKTKANDNETAKEDDEWQPLLVTTKYRPFHFHIPILSDNAETNDLIDFQDVLQEATEYKNPLDFNFAETPGLKSESLLRKKRGIGSWLKSLFHIKKKTTTTRRPAPPPKPPSPPPPPTKKPSHESYEAETYDYADYDADYDDTFGAGSSTSERSKSKSKGKNKQRGRPGSDSDIEIEWKPRGKEDPSKNVRYHPDQHGDTEIDWLLPKSMRKSTILARKDGSAGATAEAKVETAEVTEKPKQRPQQRRRRKHRRPIRPRYDYYEGDEEGEGGQDYYDAGPRKRPRMGKNRHAPNFEDEMGGDGAEIDPWAPRNRRRRPNSRKFKREPSAEEEEAGGEASRVSRSIRIKRSTERMSHSNGDLNYGPSMDIPKNQQVSPADKLQAVDFPIEKASKEELRLIHELLINIVKGKCPKSLESKFVDSLELNLFRIIDASNQLDDTKKETSFEMTTLIHQLVNCSIQAERSRDVLEMILMNEKFSNYLNNANEIEIGGPLYRSKRVNNLVTTENGKASPEDLINLSNFEFSLVTFVGEECKKDVSQTLLHSGGQLILQTVQNFFKGFIPISFEQYESNLNVLQSCANLILKHREEERRLKRKLQNLNSDSYLWPKLEVVPEVKEEEKLQQPIKSIGSIELQASAESSQSLSKRNTNRAEEIEASEDARISDVVSIFEDFPLFTEDFRKKKK